LCFPESGEQNLVNARIGVAFGFEVLGFFGLFFPGRARARRSVKKEKVKIKGGEKCIWSAALLSAIFWHFLLESRGFQGVVPASKLGFTLVPLRLDEASFSRAATTSTRRCSCQSEAQLPTGNYAMC